MIQEGLTFAKYLEVPGINPSLLSHANKSWRQFRWVQQNGFQPKTDTRVGTALHSFVELLPVTNFEAVYSLMPDFRKHPDNVTGTGKPSTSTTGWVREQEAEFVASHENILPRAHYYRALRMLGSIQDNPEAMELIEGAAKELTLTAELHGVDCKGRIDGLKGRTLWDVKSTNNIAPHRFGRTAADLGYVFKMSMYYRLLMANGVEVDEVKLIAVQDTKQRDDGSWSDAPDCAVFDIPLIAIENQIGRLERLLDEYRECVRTNIWPGVGNGALVIPNWAMEDEVDLVD